METQAKYFFVGVSIIVFTICIVVAVMWLSNKTTGESKKYAIYFRSQTLGGLQKDGDVTMKGIKVGTVATLQISQKNIEEVKVVVRLDSQAPVKKDTQAVIRRSLLTGIAQIDLVKGTQASDSLDEVILGEEYPIIPEGKTDLEEIAESLPELVNKTGEIVRSIRTVLSEENAEKIRTILTNTEKASADLSKSLQNINKLASDVSETSGSLRQTLDSIKQTSTNLDSKFAETLKSVRVAADVITQQSVTIGQSVNEASQALARTLESFEEPQALLAGPKKGTLGPGERVMP